MKHPRLVVAGYLLMGAWLVISAVTRITADLAHGIAVSPFTFGGALIGGVCLIVAVPMVDDLVTTLEDRHHGGDG